MPVMAVRLPDDNLDTALAELFGHDNVDWLEANQRRLAKPIADPVGNNPVDSKHTTHFVGGAWDHTRGTTAKDMGLRWWAWPERTTTRSPRTMASVSRHRPASIV